MNDISFNRPRETKAVTSVFYGINKGERIPDGYFADTLNMTGDKIPCLATRNERLSMLEKDDVAFYIEGKPVAAIDYNDKVFIATENGTLIYGNDKREGLYPVKSISKIGNGVFLSPSMLYFEENLSELKNARVCCNAQFDLTWTDDEGTACSDVSYSEEAPKEPVNGQYWYDKKNKALYKYSTAMKEWIPNAVFYTKLVPTQSFGYDFSVFNTGDAVSVFVDGDGMVAFYVDTYVAEVGSDYILLEGIVPVLNVPYHSGIRIERRAPVLDFSIAHNNRIWGCRNGFAWVYENGTYAMQCTLKKVNEIYASKLGDSLNWNCFRGLSTDSYAVSVGDEGCFTGCCELGDTVVFFKENCIYTIYGTEPSNFQTVKTKCYGVQEGSEKSIAEINGSVYYKSCHGIMKLSEGALPVCISESLGIDVWSDATAGTDGRKYYITMTTITGNHEMYVYDTFEGIWHKEDLFFDAQPLFLTYKNNLLLIGSDATNERTVLDAFVEKKIKDIIREYGYEEAKERYEFAQQFVFLYLGKSLDELKSPDGDLEGVREFLSYGFYSKEAYMHRLKFMYVSKELNSNAHLPISFGEETETFSVKQNEGRFFWKAETGIRGFEISENKRLKSVEIRMKLGAGARCDVSIEYDSSGKWESVYSFEGEGMTTYRVKDRLDKCDTYRLKLYGYGQAVIFSISETYEEAGNVGI